MKLPLLSKIPRLFSRSEWLYRLLSLKKEKTAESRNGLILVQIDGLSRSQFEKAVRDGRMPFCASLGNSHGYHLHTLYSGLPSATPSFQGELFYGVKCGVPAFQFRNPESGSLASMFNHDLALQVEQHLSGLGKNLLEHGSTFSDVFSGGSWKCNFCPTSFTLVELLKKGNPLVVGGFFLMHFFTAVKLVFLLAYELVIGLYDSIAGIVQGKNAVKELTFIPSRVLLAILLRELIKIQVKMDAARGVPIIHCNFVGYDEQSHRRGPSSRFAHRTLTGIDRAVKTIWRSAHRSLSRDYDIWIYSDHGQESCIVYDRLYGTSISDAVNRLLREFVEGRKRRHVPAKVTWMGPLVHVYEKILSEPADIHEFAAALVHTLHLPLVITREGADSARAWTSERTYLLPDETDELFSGAHPFLPEIGDDLVTLAQHPDSGTFIISGWRKDDTTLTFDYQGGAHAGPGFEETRAFALLPSDITFHPVTTGYIRPLHLREAALDFLEGNLRLSWPHIDPAAKDDIVRIMTYNIHNARGNDGVVSLERIIRILNLYHPDIIALQEVDAGRERSGNARQAGEIARRLSLTHHFHPSLVLPGSGEYGNAVLSDSPSTLEHTITLPVYGTAEQRSAISTRVSLTDRKVRCIATHLGLQPKERQLQMESLVSLGRQKQQDGLPTIICGDFNMLPGSGPYGIMTRHYSDAYALFGQRTFNKTFMGLARLDYMFVSEGIEVLNYYVPRNFLTAKASDHFPLIVDVRLPRV